MRQRLSARWAISISALALWAAPAQAQGHPDVVAKIIDEGKNRSEVWDTLTYLSEEIGPRLTGSTGLMRANTWTRGYFADLGLKNSHLFKWGELPVRFDRGPCYARVISPEKRDIAFTARSWSAGTDGPTSGPVYLAPKTLAELEEISADLEGAWILKPYSPRRRGSRRAPRNETDEKKIERKAKEAADKEAAKLRDEIDGMLDDCGIAGRITGTRGELVVTGGERGWRDLTMDTLPTKVRATIPGPDAKWLSEQIEAGERPVIEIDLQHHFSEGPFPIFNTIAEIPGTEFPDEVVIFSAHLDTWDGPGTQGTQDNGTGTAVHLEAARILMACGIKPRRTIRFCLWSGEEQGLYGSRKYAESLTEEERANISAVFVDDGGTNYQGGLVCLPSMEEMLTEATGALNAAFPEMPVDHTVRDKMPRGGGSDHASFNAIGVPGFFWIEKGKGGQEGKNYTFVHHTQFDTMRYAVPEYLVQSATCTAVTAYNMAMADSLLPRNVPEAKPEPALTEADWKPVKGDMSGEWKFQMKGDDAPTDAWYTLTVEMSEGGKFRGNLKSPSSGGKIKDGAFDKKSGKFSMIYVSPNYGDIDIAGKIGGDKLKGTLSAGSGFSVPIEGGRAQADK